MAGNAPAMRSQSLREEHSSSSAGGDLTAPGAGAVATGVGAGVGAGASGNGAGDLVRRHHTLSTSSSRLVRLERSRARLALQGVGLSEEDQEFYVPASPVRTVAGWSDAGHDTLTSFVSNPTRHSMSVSTPSAHPSIVAAAGGRQTSTGSSVVPGTSWDNYPSTSFDNNAAAVRRANSSSSSKGGSSGADPVATAVPISSAPSSANPKRSSFVVLRGAKGDAELAQRKTDAQSVATSDGDQDQVLGGLDGGQQGGSTQLRHKNSLKPFLDAEAAVVGGEEEWEKSLKDERNKEEMELYKDSAPLSSSFPTASDSIPFSHSRATTFEHAAATGSSSPWNDAQDVSGVGVRRHQSLNSFRPSRNEHDPMPATSPDNWAGASHLTSSSEEMLGSKSLSAAANSFTRSRAGTSPAPLALQQSSHRQSPNPPYGTSLGHSNSLSAVTGTRHHAPHAGLSHSNSLDRGTLSPAFPRSPWSPTIEETKQLNITSAISSKPTGALGGLSRGESTSSRGSRADEEVSRLGDELAQLETGDRSSPGPSYPLNRPPKTPPGFEAMPNTDESLSPRQQAGIGRSQSGSAAYQQQQQQQQQPRGRLPPLMTNMEAYQQQQQQILNGNAQYIPRQGPASAAAYVPPIGHSHLQGAGTIPGTFAPSVAYAPTPTEDVLATARGNFTAVPGATASEWHRQKEQLIGASAGPSAFPPSVVGMNQAAYMPGAPNGSAAEVWPSGGGFGVGIAMQQQQQIQVLQSQMQQALTAMDIMRNQGAQLPPQFSGLAGAGAVNGYGATQAFSAGGGVQGGLLPAQMIGQQQPNQPQMQQVVEEASPIDISALIASKGYNPPGFGLRPANARFFVIKSYTEEDVHKSLKYEIWASTDLGNKRLDRAFRESADKGPIYLFFSVNASGHFAGMAQMLTPVDYQTSSTVWASDKWKGVLKVRWIYIKDVPLASLRHIRLSNTPENKPVTSSRDTQEVPYDAGLEVLRILATYQSRTSLIQDFAWYEARTKAEGTQQEENRPPHYTRQQTASPQPPSHYPPRTSSSPYHEPRSSQTSHGSAQYGMQSSSGLNGTGNGIPYLQQSPQQAPAPSKNGGGRRFLNTGQNVAGPPRSQGGGNGPQVF